MVDFQWHVIVEMVQSVQEMGGGGWGGGGGRLPGLLKFKYP